MKKEISLKDNTFKRQIYALLKKGMVIKMNVDIRDYGACGDGETLNTALIQKAIDDVAASGGGRVTVEGGRYLTGTIILKTGTELHLSADGVLLGSPDCRDFPERTDVCHVNSEHLPRWRNACLIFAEESRNLSITGNGTIDCNGQAFVVENTGGNWGWKYKRINAPTPPRVVFFTGCRNVKIEDVTMTNQPAGWSYWIHDCDYVSITRVKILAEVNYPNNDGIHINCSRNVSVSDSFITTGDDSIVVRANSVSLRENKVCEKVTVTNCSLTSYSGGIRIGWYNDGVIRNCTFSNLVMTDTTVGISLLLPYIELDRNKIGSADIGREATLVENMTFDNIIMDRVSSNPVLISVSDNEKVRIKAIRNLAFRGVRTRGPEYPHLCGRKSLRLNNISFSDCHFEITDGTEITNRGLHGANADLDGTFHAEFVDHLSFNNTSFDIL